MIFEEMWSFEVVIVHNQWTVGWRYLITFSYNVKVVASFVQATTASLLQPELPSHDALKAPPWLRRSCQTTTFAAASPAVTFCMWSRRRRWPSPPHRKCPSPWRVSELPSMIPVLTLCCGTSTPSALTDPVRPARLRLPATSYPASSLWQEGFSDRNGDEEQWSCECSASRAAEVLVCGKKKLQNG